MQHARYFAFVFLSNKEQIKGFNYSFVYRFDDSMRCFRLLHVNPLKTIRTMSIAIPSKIYFYEIGNKMLCNMNLEK